MSCISHINLCPSSGDTENVLLQKILQSLNAGGGGGGAGVSSISVNGGAPQTGAVSIVTGGGGGVSSVNGDPGPAVLLDSGEITEGANLYFTTPRVRSTILTGLVIAGGAVSAADTVLSALGKYQFRINALETGTTGPFVLRAGDTMTGPLVISPSAANQTLLDLNSFSLTGATALPALRITGEWNTSGAPTILDVDVVDTASAAASNIFNFKFNTVPTFHLRKDGRLTLAGRAAFNTVSSLGHALAVTDATNTNAVLVLTLQHVLSAGTAGAGMGILIDQNIDSTTTVNTRAARWITAWTDATHATRSAQTTFQSFDAGVEVINMILGNGQVQGNAGTVADPSFTNRNDQNTGMYFPAADQIGFSLGGAATPEVLLTAGIATFQSAIIAVSITANDGTFSGIVTASTLRLDDTGAGSVVHLYPDGAVPDVLVISDETFALPPVAVVFGATGDPTHTSLRFAPGLINFRLADESAYADIQAAHLQLADSTALGGDPTAAINQWSDTGEWQYRTSTASEGSGQTNRVHNRTQQVDGTGTAYSLTTSLARIDMGTTDPEIVLPTAGTYALFGNFQFLGTTLTANDVIVAAFRNSTDSTFVTVGAGTSVLPVSAFQSIHLSAVISITASKTIQLWAQNASAARGTVTGASIVYIRLF